MGRFAAVGIIVADMAVALAFYRRLGLDVPPDADGEAHVDVALPGGIRLMFDTEELIRSIDPDHPLPTERGRIVLAFACASPAEVDRLAADLAAAGYRIHEPPWDAFWGQRYATVLDPDGNAIDLFAALD
jgi:catechol 2,3-dioxygenase-like lactoylglutathione lyase family enzyme